MLITAEYKDIQTELHKDPNYGVASVGYAPFVSDLINITKSTEILDYGAGKGRLAKNLSIGHQAKVFHYDPAVEEYSETPEPREFVACIDVLEHIEPENLNDVLDDLKRVTSDTGFFTVHTGAAVKTLSDGRNAHLTQEPLEWWLPKLMERFSIQSLSVVKNGFWVIVKNGNINSS